MKRTIKNITLQLKKLSFYVNWIIIFMYFIIVPSFIDLSVSMRFVFALALLCLLFRISNKIIFAYTLVYFLTNLLLRPRFNIEEKIAVEIFYYILIYLFTELVDPVFHKFKKDTLLFKEP
jgi:hypothetical protein